ncbi:hypothetical protein GCM10010236_10050 [Streptomyces eurythermus]|nr:hypothetical protein GCM10010236_10050 [Streptomyces eurythermus]
MDAGLFAYGAQGGGQWAAVLVPWFGAWQPGAGGGVRCVQDAVGAVDDDGAARHRYRVGRAGCGVEGGGYRGQAGVLGGVTEQIRVEEGTQIGSAEHR